MEKALIEYPEAYVEAKVVLYRFSDYAIPEIFALHTFVPLCVAAPPSLFVATGRTAGVPIGRRQKGKQSASTTFWKSASK